MEMTPSTPDDLDHGQVGPWDRKGLCSRLILRWILPYQVVYETYTPHGGVSSECACIGRNTALVLGIEIVQATCC